MFWLLGSFSVEEQGKTTEPPLTSLNSELERDAENKRELKNWEPFTIHELNFDIWLCEAHLKFISTDEAATVKTNKYKYIYNKKNSYSKADIVHLMTA